MFEALPRHGRAPGHGVPRLAVPRRRVVLPAGGRAGLRGGRPPYVDVEVVDAVAAEADVVAPRDASRRRRWRRGVAFLEKQNLVSRSRAARVGSGPVSPPAGTTRGVTLAALGKGRLGEAQKPARLLRGEFLGGLDHVLLVADPALLDQDGEMGDGHGDGLGGVRRVKGRAVEGVLARPRRRRRGRRRDAGPALLEDQSQGRQESRRVLEEGRRLALRGDQGGDGRRRGRRDVSFVPARRRRERLRQRPQRSKSCDLLLGGVGVEPEGRIQLPRRRRALLRHLGPEIRHVLQQLALPSRRRLTLEVPAPRRR
mmetsp:Transcript_37844/g.121414  ORF Transcript_37844/g.121414 Transcript_37844/m.121414 type:complete len:312 (+) Transcript_37844:1149-2084(+)